MLLRITLFYAIYDMFVFIQQLIFITPGETILHFESLSKATFRISLAFRLQTAMD